MVFSERCSRAVQSRGQRGVKSFARDNSRRTRDGRSSSSGAPVGNMGTSLVDDRGVLAGERARIDHHADTHLGVRHRLHRNRLRSPKAWISNGSSDLTTRSRGPDPPVKYSWVDLKALGRRNHQVARVRVTRIGDSRLG
jgi:hypothetical protein